MTPQGSLKPISGRRPQTVAERHAHGRRDRRRNSFRSFRFESKVEGFEGHFRFTLLGAGLRLRGGLKAGRLRARLRLQPACLLDVIAEQLEANSA